MSAIGGSLVIMGTGWRSAGTSMIMTTLHDFGSLR
jgi:hypothetical protein